MMYPQRGPGAWLLALSLLVATTAFACDERSGGGTVTPSDYGSDSELEPEGEFEGESINELEIRLNRLVGEQEQLVAAGTKDPGKCEELCELQQAICEVKKKMCEIADEHVSDDEYQNLCRQAKQRCQRASESCIRCVEHHERAQHGGRQSGGRQHGGRQSGGRQSGEPHSGGRQSGEPHSGEPGTCEGKPDAAPPEPGPE